MRPFFLILNKKKALNAIEMVYFKWVLIKLVLMLVTPPTNGISKVAFTKKNKIYIRRHGFSLRAVSFPPE